MQPALQLTLEVPARIRAGEPVPLKLTISNRSDRPLDLYLRGRRPTADVVVRSADGAVAWRNLQDVAIPAILLLRPLAAGETLVLRETWPAGGGGGRARARPGAYQVEAELLAEGPAPLRFPAAVVEVLR